MPGFTARGKPLELVARRKSSRYILSVPETLRFIRPCSPIRAAKPPAGDGWIHEPKLDGYRLQIVKNGRIVRLYSRNGHDWGRRIPCMVDALQALPCQAAVIDAELVAQAEDGAPDFYGLPAAICARPHELTVFAFDLLHRDGVDLRPLPLSQRKDQLARLVRRSKVRSLQLVASFPDGALLLATAERLRLEGIVSKRRTAAYSSGECRDWRNVKTVAWREANRERWRLFERETPQ